MRRPAPPELEVLASGVWRSCVTAPGMKLLLNQCLVLLLILLGVGRAAEKPLVVEWNSPIRLLKCAMNKVRRPASAWTSRAPWARISGEPWKFGMCRVMVLSRR